jgi:hypothetical protein
MRRALALPIALAAITLVGTLVAAIAFLTVVDGRVADNTRRLHQSFGVTEGGAAEVIRTWSPAAGNARQLYPTDSLQLGRVGSPGGVGGYGGTIYKLTNQMYFVDLTGVDSLSLAGRLRSGGARQRVGMLLRIIPLETDIRAALTVGGPVTFGGGNVFINGTDHVPPAWPSCGPLDTARAGVRAKAAGDVASSNGQVTGNPNVLVTPTMDSTTFLQYGSVSYGQLVARASITLGSGTYAPVPVSSAGTCTLGPTNWGDATAPGNPCGGYFPITHIAGNATLTGGQGQGVLLVDGNLTLSGSFTFNGLVVVRGSFTTTPGGSSTIYGGLLAQSINLSTTAFNGDINVNFSRCALQKAMDATGVVALARSRSWVRLM